jgi:hypothetical protein
MPDSARVWVFGADRPLDDGAQARLLAAVDAYLTQWHAHGIPLVSARELRDARFLAIAVDEAATGASGCSLDAFFRVLADLERELGISMRGGGRVFWRDADGMLAGGSREEFAAAARAGSVNGDTLVYDLAVKDAGAWRGDFELPAADSWHARLLKVQER